MLRGDGDAGAATGGAATGCGVTTGGGDTTGAGGVADGRSSGVGVPAAGPVVPAGGGVAGRGGADSSGGVVGTGGAVGAGGTASATAGTASATVAGREVVVVDTIPCRTSFTQDDREIGRRPASAAAMLRTRSRCSSGSPAICGSARNAETNCSGAVGGDCPLSRKYARAPKAYRSAAGVRLPSKTSGAA